MLVDPTYSTSEGFRLSLGFPSPLYAGAFLVLLHFTSHWGRSLWSKSKAGIITIAALTTVTSIGVGLTGSRTSVAALLAGLFYMFLCERVVLKRRRPQLGYKLLGLIFCSLLLGLFASGTWIRLSGHYLMTDPSVINRLALWSAGLRAFSAASFWGVGVDQSALTYLNWYAPIDAPYSVTGFSSTLLTLAVEQGFVLFCFVVLLLVAPIAAPWILRYRVEDSIAPAGGCLAILLSLCATTLSLSILLAIAEAAFALVAVLQTIRASGKLPSQLRWGALAGICLGVVTVTLSIRLAPDYYRGTEVLRMKFYPDGRVSVANESLKPVGKNYIWCEDPEITGMTYGHVIRKFMTAVAGPAKLELLLNPDKYTTSLTESPNSTVLLLGSARLPISFQLAGATCVFVHPTRAPDSQDDRWPVKCVLLPAVDQIGWNDSWTLWARQRSIPIYINPQTGRNLYFAWHLLADILQR